MMYVFVFSNGRRHNCFLFPGVAVGKLSLWCLHCVHCIVFIQRSLWRVGMCWNVLELLKVYDKRNMRIVSLWWQY